LLKLRQIGGQIGNVKSAKPAFFAWFYGFSTTGRPNAAVQIGVIAACSALTDLAVASDRRNDIIENHSA
jgi:hypothetical protein